VVRARLGSAGRRTAERVSGAAPFDGVSFTSPSLIT
jgi:hypothetical protein